jgi:hypothetical protein
MGGIFDRLKKLLDEREAAHGITALDLADLPDDYKRIMLMILREAQVTYPELCAAVDNLPEAERISREDLDRALDMLLADNWLIRLGLEGLHTYKVNLRRRPGSDLSTDIWLNLDAKIQTGQSGSDPED